MRGEDLRRVRRTATDLLPIVVVEALRADLSIPNDLQALTWASSEMHERPIAARSDPWGSAASPYR